MKLGLLNMTWTYYLGAINMGLEIGIKLLLTKIMFLAVKLKTHKLLKNLVIEFVF